MHDVAQGGWAEQARLPGSFVVFFLHGQSYKSMGI